MTHSNARRWSALGAALFLVATLGACNTTRGVGKDVEAGGEADPRGRQRHQRGHRRRAPTTSPTSAAPADVR